MSSGSLRDERGIHPFRLGHGNLVTGIGEQDESPVTLLVSDTRKIAFVIEPWSRRLPRETLNSTESRILNKSAFKIYKSPRSNKSNSLVLPLEIDKNREEREAPIRSEVLTDVIFTTE